MAPRQRLSPQPSLEEIHSNESSETHPPSSSTRRLIQHNEKKPSKDSVVDFATLSDIARERHDFFNLIALLVVIAATVVDWDVSLLMQGYEAEVAFKGDYFWWTWGTSAAYFIIDLVWVSLVPHCVKSPGTIVKHHLVVVAYLSGPIFFPQYRWFMGACLSVEINTWFLILRRVVYKRKIPFISEAVSAFFYLSWIFIRCYLYPAIMYTFVQMAIDGVKQTNQLWHWPMIFIPVHFLLCVLNLKWSYDLFLPIIKSWFEQGANAPAVSSGL